jgi:CHAT domain-containing protein/tetratricopeptide (TPR) repeat protein
MSIRSIVRLGTAAALLCAGAPTAEAAQPRPAAIVYALAGEASAIAPGEERRPLRLFDRLPAGETLEAGPGSHLALAFRSGRRYQLGERSRVTLGTADLASRTGPVRALRQAPPLPDLAPIAQDDHPGLKAGAVRIRSETISGLSPDRGAVRLAAAVRLRFDPVPAAPKYQVQVLDLEGRVLFHAETPGTEVRVPPEVLAPGRSYVWTVETRDRPGAVARGEAALVTLDAGQARSREALRRWAQRSGAADDLRLLEGVDRALGLREEPRSAAKTMRCPFSAPGLVLETVAPESAASRAGLMPGDRLLSWCRAPREDGDCMARGELRTPFDWLDLQMEDVQVGGVVVAGTRGPETLRWTLLPTFQGLTVAPLFQGTLAEAYQAFRDLESTGEPASAGEKLERAAELAEQSQCAGAALWLQMRAAQLQAKARQWPLAETGYQEALAQARAAGAARVETHLLMSWSETLLLRGEFAQARQQLEKALALEERAHPASLRVVTLLLRLGNVLERQDDLKGADRLYRQSHDLVLRLAPDSGGEAAAAANLAVITARRGDLAQAEIYTARALAIREKLTPAGEAIIPSLLSYGNVLHARGDSAGAEAAFLRARKILEHLQPKSVGLAMTLHNLGELAFERGDHAAAEDLFQRELDLFEEIDPSGILVRDSLVGLGEIALRQRQGARAEGSWRRALDLNRKLRPTGPKQALCLGGLAAALMLQGKSAEAETLLRQALAIWQEINPEAHHSGSVHLSLGLLLLDQGRTEGAEAHLRTAIRVHEKEGRRLPEGYQALARLQARTGPAAEAAATYLQAADALEAQRTRLGGAQESQWLYGSTLGDLYLEAAEHEIALRRPQEAWRFVDRGRARSFYELLAQRDLRFAGELPTALYAERGRLAAEYDRTQALIADWTPEGDAEKIETLLGRLRDLRLEQAAVQERIRQSSPRLEALESPNPLDLPAARSALDRGTALLTYAIGETRSFLFVLEAEGAPGPGFSFYPLAIGREALAQEIEAFRSLLSRPETPLAAVQQSGRRLYDLLLRPAAPVLTRADRWLISPDGPLHVLPFAALTAGGQYLAETRPIHFAASAAVYREIRSTRPEKPAAGAMEILAVGDPVYPEGPATRAETTDPQLRTALRRGLRLERLPSTRTEVQAISGLFPGGRTLLGRDATEETIKSLAPQARRLHFACHGLLDERFPLNSGLALSIPDPPREGRDNGLLQAWEIFEDLRLQADLVTLSACDSGLGQEMGGEGLVGLVRAFQFAGARSVLASLWSVSDTSTADLMKRFYSYLREGRTKDEALRAAQIDLIRTKGGELSHPYHWAGFALHGDWR